jgi:hypothetical protein
MADNTEQLRNDISGPGLAPAILTLGSVFWRIVSWWKDVTFLMSMHDESLTTLFNFLQSYGWWILALVGLVWFVQVRGKPQSDSLKPGWGLVLVIGVLAFMTGMLLAIRASGSVPNVISGWGPAPGGCTAAVQMNKLTTFRDTYKVALVCGIIDRARDMMEDDRVTISSLFTIVPGAIQIQAQHKADLVAFFSAPNQQMWFEAILLPEGTDIARITRLSDVKKYKGKILHEGLYE